MIRPVPLLLPSVCDGRRASRRLELVSAVATRRAPVSPVPGWAGAPAPYKGPWRSGSDVSPGEPRHECGVRDGATPYASRSGRRRAGRCRRCGGSRSARPPGRPAWLGRQGGLHGSAASEACTAWPPTCPRASVAQQVGGPCRAGPGAGVRRGFRHAARCPERTSRSRPRPRAECRSGFGGSWMRIDGRRTCACEVPSTDATRLRRPSCAERPAPCGPRRSRDLRAVRREAMARTASRPSQGVRAPLSARPSWRDGRTGDGVARPPTLTADRSGPRRRRDGSGGVRGSARLVAVLRRPRTHPVCRSGGGPCQGCAGQRADIARGRNRGGGHLRCSTGDRPVGRVAARG